MVWLIATDEMHCKMCSSKIPPYHKFYHFQLFQINGPEFVEGNMCERCWDMENKKKDYLKSAKGE